MHDNPSIERKGASLHITLDRPESGNKITNEMGAQIIAALGAIDSETKLVVLRGAGADFCLGRQSPQIDRATATAQTFRAEIAAPPLALYQAFRDCPVPVVGVVQGRAVGVGCALATLCDFTIAGHSASFDLPELSHGIPPTLVMSALSGRIPYQAIAFMVLTGKPLTAAQAEQWGIIALSVPEESLEAEAGALADIIIDRPADALRGIKEYLTHAVAGPAETRSAYAATLIATVLSSRQSKS